MSYDPSAVEAVAPGLLGAEVQKAGAATPGQPPWARDLAEQFFAGASCLFVLHGNVHDIVRQSEKEEKQRETKSNSRKQKNKEGVETKKIKKKKMKKEKK